MYDKISGKNMPLKEFTVKHIRQYEAALFLDLASDWPALTKWDETYFCSDFDQLLEVFEFNYSSNEPMQEKH